MIEHQQTMFVWAAAVALAIVAGAWAAMNRNETRLTLPPEHVAGAAIIGLFGWEMLVHLPGTVMGFWTLTAGLGDVGGVEGYQAHMVAQAAFVIAAAFAVIGILRRRTWGAILGIGLASARVVASAAALFQTFTLYAESMGGDVLFDLVSSVVGLQTIPALAAIALLAWPLLRRTTPRAHASDADVPATNATLEPR